MAEISPAAQAVYEAAWAAYWPEDAEHPADAELIAAAALRAVANQGTTFYWDGCPVQAVTVGSLLTIADELEAQ